MQVLTNDKVKGGGGGASLEDRRDAGRSELFPDLDLEREARVFTLRLKASRFFNTFQPKYPDLEKKGSSKKLFACLKSDRQ